jgi:hypothetical protein
MECITVCPTVEKKTMTANMTGRFLKPVFAAIIGLGIYAGIVGISMATGIWKTQESSLNETLKEGDEINPDNIRGFMTMEEIAKTFNLNINVLYNKLGITKNNVPETTQMKKVKDLAIKDGKNIGEDEVRNAVRELMMPVKGENENIPINETKEGDKTKSNETVKAEIKSGEIPKTETKIISLPNPADITGTMTLKEITDTYKIDINKLYEKLKITEDKVPETTTGKDLKGILLKEGRNFEVQEIRDAVKELMK